MAQIIHDAHHHASNGGLHLDANDTNNGNDDGNENGHAVDNGNETDNSLLDILTCQRRLA